MEPGRGGVVEEVAGDGSRFLLFALALFCALLFLELPGSFPLEPDEARYAEIPREMLSSGNLLVPKLNGVDYFEKPPLLYWENAAALKLFGANSYAARLPCRLSALAAALIVALFAARRYGGRTGLLAGLAAISSILGFALGRTNLTDGPLTFSMTLAAVSIARFLAAREEGKRGAGAAALTGLGCGLAVLAKGLVGIVLPGGALLLWCALSKRWRRVPEIVASPAPIVCLAATVPYFLSVEMAAPGFSRFFWIHEHFARYATPEASRPGPPYYFLAAFVVGFLPWSFFLPAVVRRFRQRGRRFDLDDLWFASYAVVILVFFSVSRSKLVPYILPMFPAAAFLVARAVGERLESIRGPLFAQALFWSLAAPAGLAIGFRSGELQRYGLSIPAVGAALALVAFSWAGFARARRLGLRAVVLTLAGWMVLYAVLIAAFPSIAADQSAERLAAAAGEAAGADAEVVCFRTYLQGFPWFLERRIAIYGWKGELEFGSLRGDQSAWFRPRESFWRDWDSGKKMVALLRKRDRAEMEQHRGSLVAENRKYVVVRNF